MFTVAHSDADRLARLTARAICALVGLCLAACAGTTGTTATTPNASTVVASAPRTQITIPAL
jgi:hypothetical protein